MTDTLHQRHSGGSSLSEFLKNTPHEEKSRFFEAALERASEQQRDVIREAGATYQVTHHACR